MSSAVDKTRDRPTKSRTKKQSGRSRAGAGQATVKGTIGFRPTEHDRELLTKLAREGETQTDVLRRSLEALEQLEWERQAQDVANRLMSLGEDLSDEPDAW